MTKNIICAGSSITWTGGLLDGGFVGYMDDYLKNQLATTILGDAMTYSPEQAIIVNNPKCYKEHAWKISGLGAAIEFDIEGDQLHLCQFIDRTSNYAQVSVYADKQLLGQFDNENPSIGQEEKTFAGDGETVLFGLDSLFTYEHQLKVGDNTLRGELSAHDYGEIMADNHDFSVIRRHNGQSIEHAIMFKQAPQKDAIIHIKFRRAETIAHCQCTYGENNNGKMESVYGMGDIAYDPANPTLISSGLDFRQINTQAITSFKLPHKNKHRIRLEITGGETPYFAINYASNQNHRLMNAGIGGWQLNKFLEDKEGRDYVTACKDFTPDVMFLEYATNDDWFYAERKVTRTIQGVSEADLKSMPSLKLHAAQYQADSDTFCVTVNTGLITGITHSSLSAQELYNAHVVPGDIVRIGNYRGDIRSTCTREIKTFDSASATITWEQPLSPEDLVGINELSDLISAEMSIRSLSAYEEKYYSLIKKIRAIHPAVKLFIANPGASNYYFRQLWGYDIVHRRLAQKLDHCDVIDVAEQLLDHQDKQISGNTQTTLSATTATSYPLNCWLDNNQGFRVIIDGQDVYGKTCIIESHYGYTVAQDKSKQDLNFSGNYHRPETTLKSPVLTFFQSPPPSWNHHPHRKIRHHMVRRPLPPQRPWFKGIRRCLPTKNKRRFTAHNLTWKREPTKAEEKAQSNTWQIQSSMM